MDIPSVKTGQQLYILPKHAGVCTELQTYCARVWAQACQAGPQLPLRPTEQGSAITGDPRTRALQGTEAPQSKPTLWTSLSSDLRAAHELTSRVIL